jgi:hypothetical protein
VYRAILAIIPGFSTRIYLQQQRSFLQTRNASVAFLLESFIVIAVNDARSHSQNSDENVTLHKFDDKKPALSSRKQISISTKHNIYSDH